MATSNVSAGGVFITVGLDTSDVAAQAQSVAATVAAAFSNVGVANIGNLANEFRTAETAGVQTAENVTQALAKTETQAARTARAMGSLIDERMLMPTGAGSLGADQMEQIRSATKLRVEMEAENERLVAQEVAAEQRANDAKIASAKKFHDSVIKDAIARGQLAEKIAQEEIAAQQRIADSRARFKETQAFGPVFTQAKSAGFSAAEAVEIAMQEEKRKTSEVWVRETARIEAERVKNVRAAKTEAEQITKLQQDMNAAIETPTRTPIKGAQLFGGIAQAAFGASLAKNGSVISGAALSVSGLTQALGAMGVSLGAGPIGAIAAVTVGVLAMVKAMQAATSATVKFISGVVEAAAGLETTAVAFETLTGSAALANAEFKNLAGIAIESPFNLKDVAELDRFLLAADVGSKSLRQDLVKSVTDIGAAFGFGADRLQLIAFAMAQVQTAGRLTMDEGRQLRNQMIPVVQVLQSLPKFAATGSAEIKQMIEDGMIDSKTWFDATIAWSEQFEGAAARQANTVNGLMENIKEAVTTTAGVKFGPTTFGGVDALAPIRDFLIQIKNVVTTIDWTALANAVKGFFSAFSAGVTDALGSSGIQGVKTLFEGVLPKAISFLTTALEPLIAIVDGVARSFIGIFWDSDAFNQATDDAGSMHDAMVVMLVPIRLIGTAMIALATIFGTAWDFIYVTVKEVSDAVIAVLNWIWEQVAKIGGAIADLGSALPSWLGGDQFKDAADFFHDQADSAGDASINAWRALDRAGAEGAKQMTDTLEDGWNAIFKVWDTGVGRMGDLSKGGGAGPQPSWFENFLSERGGIDQEIESILAERKKVDEENAKVLADAAKKAADHRQDLLNQLAEMTQSWFGQNSELAKGFVGAEGFDATIDTIASTAKRLTEIMQGLGREDVVRVIANQTKTLLNLAKMRDAIAENLKKAEDKLTEAIQARDDMISQIRKSSIDFVNAFSQEEEKFTEIITTATGYHVVERTRTKGFVQGLRDRLAALRKFIAQVRALGARGLDADLLKTLIEAGPETAGTVVDELALSSDATLNEVNQLQTDLKGAAQDFGVSVGRDFHQAGIDMLQASVDGIKSQKAAVDAAALYAFSGIANQVGPIANAGWLAGQGFARNLAQGIREGVKEASRTLSAFHVQYMAVTKATTNLEILRQAIVQKIAETQAKPLTNFVYPPGYVGPKQTSYTQAMKDQDIRNLQGALATVDTKLEQVWRPFMENAMSGFAAGANVNVYIGGDKINEIATAEVDRANQSALFGASTGSRP